MALDVLFSEDVKRQLDAAVLAGFDLETLTYLAVAFSVRLDVWDSRPGAVLTAGTGDGLAPLDKAGILRGRWDVERRR